MGRPRGPSVGKLKRFIPKPLLDSFSLDQVRDGNTYKRIIGEMLDDEGQPLAIPGGERLKDFLGSVYLFSDSFISNDETDAPTPPERNLTLDIETLEAVFPLKTVFRMRKGLAKLRFTAYFKYVTTWSGTNEARLWLWLKDFDASNTLYSVWADIDNEDYEKQQKVLDMSSLTDGEIYQIWLGYGIQHGAGTGESTISMIAPVLELLPG